MKRIAIIAAVLTTSLLLYAATANMGLNLPTVGTTTGPEWASQINTAFQVVDAHTHAPGSGVQISNAGISSSAAIDRSKIAPGSVGYVVINGGSSLVANSGTLSQEAQLAVSRGGTNIGSYTAGDILYASSSGALSKLAIGTSGQALKVSSGLPAWASAQSSVATTTKTANYNILSTDDLVIGNNASSSFTLTLPDCTSNPGKVYYLKRLDTTFDATKFLTVATSGGDTIEGGLSSVVMGSQSDELILASAGTTQWKVIYFGVTVAMSYKTTATTSIGTGAGTTLSFSGTKVFDTQSAYSAGTYTVPYNGTYYISSSIRFTTSGNYAVGNNVKVRLFQGGSLVRDLGTFTAQSVNNQSFGAAGDTVVRATGGQAILINGTQDTANTIALNAADDDNYVTIIRIGN